MYGDKQYFLDMINNAKNLMNKNRIYNGEIDSLLSTMGNVCRRKNLTDVDFTKLENLLLSVMKKFEQFGLDL